MRRRGFLAGLAGVVAAAPVAAASVTSQAAPAPGHPVEPFAVENGQVVLDADQVVITSGRIESADGQSFIDLSSGRFCIADVSHPDEAPEPFRTLLN